MNRAEQVIYVEYRIYHSNDHHRKPKERENDNEQKKNVWEGVQTQSNDRLGNPIFLFEIWLNTMQIEFIGLGI